MAQAPRYGMVVTAAVVGVLFLAVSAASQDTTPPVPGTVAVPPGPESKIDVRCEKSWWVRTLHVVTADIREVLRVLSGGCGIRIGVPEGVVGTVTLHEEENPLESVISDLLAALGGKEYVVLYEDVDMTGILIVPLWEEPVAARPGPGADAPQRTTGNAERAKVETGSSPPASASATVPDDWLTYTDRTWKYEMKYPKRLKPKKPWYGDDGVVAFTDRSGKENLLVMTSPLAGLTGTARGMCREVDLSPQELLTVDLHQFCMDSPLESVEWVPIEISGRPGMLAAGSSDPCLSISLPRASVVRGVVQYLFLYEARDREEFLRLLSSVRFLK